MFPWYYRCRSVRNSFQFIASFVFEASVQPTDMTTSPLQMPYEQHSEASMSPLSIASTLYCRSGDQQCEPEEGKTSEPTSAQGPWGPTGAAATRIDEGSAMEAITREMDHFILLLRACCIDKRDSTVCRGG